VTILVDAPRSVLFGEERAWVYHLRELWIYGMYWYGLFLCEACKSKLVTQLTRRLSFATLL